MGQSKRRLQPISSRSPHLDERLALLRREPPRRPGRRPDQAFFGFTTARGALATFDLALRLALYATFSQAPEFNDAVAFQAWPGLHLRVYLTTTPPDFGAAFLTSTFFLATTFGFACASAGGAAAPNMSHTAASAAAASLSIASILVRLQLIVNHARLTRIAG